MEAKSLRCPQCGAAAGRARRAAGGWTDWGYEAGGGFVDLLSLFGGD